MIQEPLTACNVPQGARICQGGGQGSYNPTCGRFKVCGGGSVFSTSPCLGGGGGGGGHGNELVMLSIVIENVKSVDQDHICRMRIVVVVNVHDDSVVSIRATVTQCFFFIQMGSYLTSLLQSHLIGQGMCHSLFHNKVMEDGF